LERDAVGYFSEIDNDIWSQIISDINSLKEAEVHSWFFDRLNKGGIFDLPNWLSNIWDEAAFSRYIEGYSSLGTIESFFIIIDFFFAMTTDIHIDKDNPYAVVIEITVPPTQHSVALAELQNQVNVALAENHKTLYPFALSVIGIEALTVLNMFSLLESYLPLGGYLSRLEITIIGE